MLYSERNKVICNIQTCIFNTVTFWRQKLPTIRPFVQEIIQFGNKENTKVPNYAPFLWESTVWFALQCIFAAYSDDMTSGELCSGVCKLGA